MSRSNIVTGLDIGSSKISAAAAEIDRNGSFAVRAQITQGSSGISRGVITNLGEAVDSVSSVLNRLRDKISRPLNDIYVNISSESVKGGRSKGMIALSLRGREVTMLDMDRCAQAAGTIHLPFDREIIHRIVHNFSVDDQAWVKKPLGLYASRLNCEVYIVSAGVNHIQNIYKCVNNAGYVVKDIVFSGIADGTCVIEKEEKEKGVLLLGLGDSLTEVSFFFGGELSDMEVIGLGAKDVTGDFKKSALFNDLMSRVESRMRDFLKGGGRIESITLTGGMSFTDYLAEFIEERLGRPVRMGSVKEIRGDISSAESARLSTAIGLVKYAHGKHEQKIAGSRNPVKNFSARVVDILSDYF